MSSGWDGGCFRGGRPGNSPRPAVDGHPIRRTPHSPLPAARCPLPAARCQRRGPARKYAAGTGRAAPGARPRESAGPARPHDPADSARTRHGQPVLGRAEAEGQFAQDGGRASGSSGSGSVEDSPLRNRMLHIRFTSRRPP
ncbi:hypothetical protein GCM10023335_34360 [Streptomyces siamensis]|uniref:Uncharacterized protein n=1 Tax=Streptomyces siamensis TaxID=1274986 RepID=A0ABP9IY53_9ACTN